MGFEQKIMYGFSDIHVAKMDGKGAYVTPVLVEGAKSIEAEFNFEHTPVSADNRTIYFGGFAGGEGTLGVLSLTPTEMNLLFGHEMIGQSGYVMRSNDIAPNVALGFSREKRDGGKQGYWIYDCKFKPSGFSAETMEEGKSDESILELEFTIAETADRKIAYVDTVTDTFFETVPVNPTSPPETAQVLKSK